jgi:type II secretory pathway component PulF
MLTAGTEAVSAAQNAAAAAGNSVVKRQLAGALYVLEAGRAFKEYFAVTTIFNTDQLAIVSVGEESGALPQSLERMALQMEDSSTHRFNMLMKGTGVLVYLIAAAIVAFTVLSFYIGHFRL